MLTIRIITELAVPEGVDSALMADRFQEIVEAAVHSEGLVADDSDVLFDVVSDEMDRKNEESTDWVRRFSVLEGVLGHLTLDSGDHPVLDGHWQPGPDGHTMTVRVSIGPRVTDTATLKVRFSAGSTDLADVSCTDHTGKSVAQWDGWKGNQ